MLTSSLATLAIPRLGHAGGRAATKTNTPDRERRTRCAGTAGYLPGGGLSDRGGHDWLHCLGQTRTVSLRRERWWARRASRGSCQSSSSCRMTKSCGSCQSKTCPTSTWSTVTPIGEAPNPDGVRLGPLNRLVPTQSITATQHVMVQAQLYATRRAAGGIQSVQLLKLKLEVLTDSTASIGMHSRISCGRVRHLDVRWLWAQEAVQRGDSR